MAAGTRRCALPSLRDPLCGERDFGVPGVPPTPSTLSGRCCAPPLPGVSGPSNPPRGYWCVSEVDGREVLGVVTSSSPSRYVSISSCAFLTSTLAGVSALGAVLVLIADRSDLERTSISERRRFCSSKEMPWSTSKEKLWELSWDPSRASGKHPCPKMPLGLRLLMAVFVVCRSSTERGVKSFMSTSRRSDAAALPFFPL
mmetsp:Transcript_46315/g.112763  ORF Transcript_46315/g.112763 Transcript_46315/m.112763 type:complete len:200 (-) Transcript_46315:297-896(-)